MKSKVGIVGLWHLGSVYSACLAELGHDVTAVDPDVALINNFTTGHAPLFEPGLDDLIAKNIRAKRLSFSTNYKDLANCDFVFVAFDTPVDENDKSDLSGIIKAVKKIASVKKTPGLIVISSQVPVGTCDQFKEMVHKINPTLEFDIIYLPENLRLGDALNVFLKADRFVVGSDDPKSYQKMASLLAGTGAPLVTISLKSAEMAKHSLNSFLATCVSFTNELADVCEIVGANVTEVAEALKSDIRIGKKAYLNAGLGFAGGTLARDLITLGSISKKAHIKLPVISGALTTNNNRIVKGVTRVERVVGSIKDKTIGVLGLTYKPGTSTLRRSVSLAIIDQLSKHGARIKAYDPKADLGELVGSKKFDVADTLQELAKGTDAILVVTGWPEFQEINFKEIVDLTHKPVIIDLINFISKEGQQKAIECGFAYYGTGLGGN